MKRGVVKTIEESYVQDGEKMIVHTVKVPIKDKREKAIGVLGIFWTLLPAKRWKIKLLTIKRIFKHLRYN